MWFWIYIFLAVTADMAGIFFAKKWVDDDKAYWLITALFCYILVGLFFAQVLRFEGITISNIVWTVSAIILGTIMGTLLFNEKLMTLQWVGVAVAIFGVLLIQWPSK